MMPKDISSWETMHDQIAYTRCEGGAKCSVAREKTRVACGHLPYLPMTWGKATAAFPTLSRAFPSIVQACRCPLGDTFESPARDTIASGKVRYERGPRLRFLTKLATVPEEIGSQV